VYPIHNILRKVQTEIDGCSNNLAQLRAKRGLAAAELEAQTGISRQTIHAIEAGLYVPNTAVSLKLACILDTTVGELFQLEAEHQSV
jgi:putative transcriptional regulator